MRAVRGGAGPAAPPPGRGCRVPGGPGPRVLPCSALPAHPLRSPRERSSARGAPQAAMSCAVPAAGGSQQSHEEDDRKVRRREKNRVAAQRSRKKQTQKADKLHECKRRRTGIPFVCFGMLPQQQCFVVGRALGVSISAAVAVAEALQPWSFSTGFSQ
ncbi:basic leucine zipper transcriptional factor ATF-like 3 isoform X4 [Neopsephotus bourkii]|uniref:basic leucine zipper transcriptional factor ATF-like 3 isoform X4 n=1 Tax=Neopsephotus bourkii TaxID=309878 RepID=UPI002AA56823|nr:basic leucine zipper transcriptional factor ATF-like 3 isoform X4 [Neopsephotus bourkii]